VKEVITTEMKKAFRSKGFFVAALAGVLVAVIQTIWAYQNIYQVNMKERNHILGLPVTDEHYGSWFQTCIMQGWIGCEYYSSFNQFLFLSLPLFAVLPYSISLYSEWKSGYAMQMLVRRGRKQYITGKALAVFFSGGCAIAAPLLISLLLSACYLPAVGIDPISLQNVVGNSMMWSALFFEKPILYAISYTGIVFVYGGIYAEIPLLCVGWMENRFGTLIFPMLLHCMLFYGVYNLFPKFAAYNPAMFVNPSQLVFGITFRGIVSVTVVILAVEGLLLWLSNRRRDFL
jgi:hypothetical protein